MTLLFDSHGFVKRLPAAGMPEPQAEVLAGEHTRWFDDVLATKADLAPLAKSAEIELRLKETEFRINAKVDSLALRLEATKSEIIKWAFGAVGFQTLVLVGAVLALVKIFH